MVRNVNFCIGSTAQLNTQTSSQTLPLSHNATACAQVSIQLGDLFFLKMKVWLLLAETWQASAGTAIPTVMVQHDCGNRSANSIGLWDWEQSSWDWSAKCLCQFCMVFCAWKAPRSDIQPVRNPGIIANITIFRGCSECLMWDCMGDHQGQLRLHSQEKGWVASRWF